MQTRASGSEKIMPAIAFIKRFISIQGKSGPNIKKKAQKLIADMAKSISFDNKYSSTILNIQESLYNFIDGKTTTISVTPQQLNGLNGIACGFKNNSNLAGNSKSMKKLSPKTNKLNIIDSHAPVESGVFKAKSIITFANEKNGNLSPYAEKLVKWAKEKGFEVISRPARKATINKNELYQGKSQDVVWQWTSYTIK